MTQHVRDIMTKDLVTVAPLTSVVDVAQLMRREDIGDVLVVEDGHLRGMVTDRDLVVRVMAEGGNPGDRTVASACSEDLLTVGPGDTVGDVIGLMREHAVRRVPVVEGDRPVGIVSLGDLAIERDPGSALGDISAARPDG
ncbi:CBS domain-containing protein [Streptomyces camelliae]|uniref:CBS domain-containing protein n=1 Tax=Streptomyces camelliae TaxID=3004093 RepID=A0ABY7PG72_9ACTN|nr:CBS domain-containing protein [Streptomyces sp. HUAS 2-6]WBO68567.1 CBS domain-containing protein [Streptomyces sp. HUAS 2-6]